MFDMGAYSSLQARLQAMALPERPQKVTGAALKKAEEKGVKLMLDTFTFEENMRIAFTPLVIAAIVWIYTDRARAYAVEHRLGGDSKKLTRCIKDIKDEYRKNLRTEMDLKHVQRIDDGAKGFMDNNANDFNILYYSVNNEIKRRYPDLTHQPMRTNAYIARALIHFLGVYNKSMNEMMRSRLKGVRGPVEEPYLKLLSEVLRALSGNIELGGENLKNCMLILNKNLRNIEYNID